MCIRKSDITRIVIEEDGNDGWLIDSVVTVIKKVQGDDETLTIDLDEHQWIDGDGNPNEQPGVVRICMGTEPCLDPYIIMTKSYQLHYDLLTIMHACIFCRSIYEVFLLNVDDVYTCTLCIRNSAPLLNFNIDTLC